MQYSNVLKGLEVIKSGAYAKRAGLSVPARLALAFAMAAVTGVLAHIRFYLPFTPVPVTGQVLGVLLSGVVCGGLFGSISQVMYVAFGLLGFSWFSGAGSLSVFAGPTGGYLLGFMIAPYIIGTFSDKSEKRSSLFSQVKFMLAGVGVIYFFGATYLVIIFGMGPLEALIKGVLPFAVFDLIKAFIAASAGSLMLPSGAVNSAERAEK